MEKKVVVFSGVAAAGKSTEAQIQKAMYGDDCVLSMDAIREMCGAIVRDKDGNPIRISQDYNKTVFEIYRRMVETRMMAGAYTVLDNTHLDARSLELVKNLAQKYGYSVEVHRFECSLETLLKRNTERGYKNVPEDVVRKMYHKFVNFVPEDWYVLVVHNTDN